MSSGRFLIWTKMGDGVLVFSSKYPVMSVWLAPLKLLFSSPLPVEAQVFVASHRTIAFVVVATPLVSRVGPRTHTLFRHVIPVRGRNRRDADHVRGIQHRTTD